MLLVSLQDGSIVQQHVPLDADICFKESVGTSTTCYTRQEAVFDGTGTTVIGYRMEQSRIELRAR